jgi:hypothetical protein
MGFRFEFDPVNRILLARSEGRLTDESLAEFYQAIRKYSIATDAKAGIWDLSSVTDFAVTSDFVRELSGRKPAMPDANNRPRFIVAPNPLEFGLSRMFQILGESTRPLLKVVHTLDEALAALCIQPSHFETLE